MGHRPVDNDISPQETLPKASQIMLVAPAQWACCLQPGAVPGPLQTLAPQSHRLSPQGHQSWPLSNYIGITLQAYFTYSSQGFASGVGTVQIFVTRKEMLSWCLVLQVWEQVFLKSNRSLSLMNHFKSLAAFFWSLSKLSILYLKYSYGLFYWTVDLGRLWVGS